MPAFQCPTITTLSLIEAGLHEHTQQYFAISASLPVVQQLVSLARPLTLHQAALPECPVALSAVRVRSEWSCSGFLSPPFLCVGHPYLCTQLYFGSSELSPSWEGGGGAPAHVSTQQHPIIMHMSALLACTVAFNCPQSE